MNDDASSPLQHAGQQPAVEADGGEQVGVDGVLPILVAESQHAAARCGGAPDIVDENVHAAETIQHFPDHPVHALARADVGLDEQFHRLTFRQR